MLNLLISRFHQACVANCHLPKEMIEDTDQLAIGLVTE